MTQAAEREALKEGLPPMAGPDARLFILGSLPGDASLAARQYYAHPRNQFWRLLGHATGCDLQSLPYEERLARLAAMRIGLWDVVAQARRRGSLDQAIRSPEHNPIERLIVDYPTIEAIAFNGGTAQTIGRRLVGGARGVTLIDLPSSSPANTRPFAEKATYWADIGRFCNARACTRQRSGRDGNP